MPPIWEKIGFENGGVDKMLSCKAGIGGVYQLIIRALQVHYRDANIFPIRKHLLQFFLMMDLFGVCRPEHAGYKPANRPILDDMRKPKYFFPSRSAGGTSQD